MQMPTAIVARISKNEMVPTCPACGRMVTGVEFVATAAQREVTRHIEVDMDEDPSDEDSGKDISEEAMNEDGGAEDLDVSEDAAESEAEDKNDEETRETAMPRAIKKKAPRKMTPPRLQMSSKKQGTREPARKKLATKDRRRAARVMS